MLQDMEPDEYAVLLQMSNVDLDWSTPFTFPKEPKDNRHCTHKQDDKSARTEPTCLGKRPASGLWQTQRDPVQRGRSQTSGVRALGSDTNPKVRDRALSASSIRRVPTVQKSKERGTQVQPGLAAASNGTLSVDGDTKTRAWTYSTDQRKWVTFD